MELELGGREDGPLEVTSEAGGSWKGAPAADNLLAALLPKVYHRGEVVLGKRMGSLNEKKTLFWFLTTSLIY